METHSPGLLMVIALPLFLVIPREWILNSDFPARNVCEQGGVIALSCKSMVSPVQEGCGLRVDGCCSRSVMTHACPQVSQHHCLQMLQPWLPLSTVNTMSLKTSSRIPCSWACPCLCGSEIHKRIQEEKDP